MVPRNELVARTIRGLLIDSSVAPKTEPNQRGNAVVESPREFRGIALRIERIAVVTKRGKCSGKRFSVHAIIVRVTPPASDVAAIAPVRIVRPADDTIEGVLADRIAPGRGGDLNRGVFTTQVALLHICRKT